MIDALMLLGPNRFGPTITVADAMALADAQGLDAIVAAPARPMDYHLGPANTALAQAAAASSGRLVALGRVDPTDGARAVREAIRCLDELGCAGLFLHPGEEAFPIRLARPVVDAVADRGRPIVVATGFFAQSEPLQVAELAATYPALPFVVTTGGQYRARHLVCCLGAWTPGRLKLNLPIRNIVDTLVVSRRVP